MVPSVFHWIRTIVTGKTATTKSDSRHAQLSACEPLASLVSYAIGNRVIDRASGAGPACGFDLADELLIAKHD